MSSNINPVNFGINTNSYYRQEEKEDLNQNTRNEQLPEARQQYEEKDVFNYLTATSGYIPVQSTKTIRVSEYVTPESELRIEDSMKQFQAQYEDTIAQYQNEFPGMSYESAQYAALSDINRNYLA